MPLSVTTFCTYLSTTDHGVWRPQDHAAAKFVKALKREKFRGYAYVPVLGVWRFLDNGNLPDSVSWFADMVADYIESNSMNPPFELVPVPNNDNTSGSPKRPHTYALARAIQARIRGESKVLDCLRWKSELGSVREGAGSRNPASLYQNLFVSGVRNRDSRHLLIDDCFTLGGHLRACAAALSSSGAHVAGAFCAARTVHSPPAAAFRVLTELLDDFQPQA
jgi:hypothetical protein